jgi:hypothetical protein
MTEECGNSTGFASDPINLAIYGRGGIKHGIDTAFSNGCIGSGLILLFSAIDAMANISRPEGQAESTPQDFKNWVQHYIRIGGEAAVTAEDLWGARNGLVHCYGTDSKAVRSGAARRILWALGDGIRESWAVGVQEGVPNIVVDIQAFRCRVSEGMDQFVIDIHKDQQRSGLVEERLQQLLLHVSDPAILDYVSRL